MSEEPEAQGAWIFVSHSHKDLAKVRRVRNALEERGHNPLLFFLKCLGDNSEVDDLIRREIEARTWFILCDSPNAKASKWVQAETEIIKDLEGKVFVVVDLDEDFEKQLQEIESISKRASVFISYARSDQAIAQSVGSALRAQDYAVFAEDEDLSWELTYNPRVVGSLEGQDWASTIEERIRGATATEEGFFLVLLSPDAVRSHFVRRELRVALDAAEERGRTTNIVPVVVRDYEATVGLLSAYPETRYLLYEVALWDITVGDLDRRVSQMIDDLKRRFMGHELERLAEGVHVAYCADSLERGSSWGRESDEYLLRHPLLRPFVGLRKDPALTSPVLVPYSDLPEELREQDRQLASNIPRILSAAGYTVRPARSGDRPPEFPEDVVELLAEREHERWLWAKLSSGWCHGFARDVKTRRHPDMVPWRKLTFEECHARYGEHAQCVGDGEVPEGEKQKDRRIVRMFPGSLIAAGYTAIRTEDLVD